MPYKMTKTSSGYTVSSPNRVHGRHMTLENAKKQIRLLNAVEYNPEFAAILKKKRKASKKNVAMPRS